MVPSAPLSEIVTVQPAACSSANWSKVTVFTTSSVPPAAETTMSKVTEPSSLMQALSPTRSTSRSEEHTSELQPLMRISYAVFCLKKKKEQKIKYASRPTNTK